LLAEMVATESQVAVEALHRLQGQELTLAEMVDQV
jgi:hypothetical protein